MTKTTTYVWGWIGAGELATDGWLLDAPVNRERYIRPRTDGTEPISFRITAAHLRTLDEIIHSGIDPRLKTKSDCLQDAVFMFIEDWMQHYSDGVAGRTLRLYHMERLQMQRESRDAFLDAFDRERMEAMKCSDADGLTMLYKNLLAEREESAGYAPEAYIKELDDRISLMKSLA